MRHLVTVAGTIGAGKITVAPACTPDSGIRHDDVGAALAVVGLSAERAARETAVRDHMIRVAHRAGASLRQLAEVSGLNRKTVTAIVDADVST